MSYGLYLSKIVADSDPFKGECRLQVKIIPHMDNIPNNLCPIYPYFFKDEALTGKVGELAWVISNDDFTVGYVLGLANYNSYSYKRGNLEDYTIPTSLLSDINKYLVKLKSEELAFVNMKVTFWNNDCIHFVEKTSGGSIIAFRNGTISITKPNEIFYKVGDSKIFISNNSITLDSKNIYLQSDYVGLGRNPTGNVLITSGVGKEAPVTSNIVKA